MIELIVGPMSAGKSTEMLRRLNRARIAGLSTLIIKPSIDSRGEDSVTTHDGASIPCRTVQTSTDFANLVQHNWPAVIGIDEVQFFDPGIIDVIRDIPFGIKVIVTGLDLTWDGKPFDNTLQLMAYAEKVKKLAAVCTHCGQDASRSFRKTNDRDTVLVGGLDVYCALCTPCWKNARIQRWEAP